MIVVDPMLATGNSAVAAVDRLKERGAQDICVSSACSPRPEGIERLRGAHPDVRSGRPRSTSASTSTATSCRASAMPATAHTGRSSGALATCELDAAVRTLVFASAKSQGWTTRGDRGMLRKITPVVALTILAVFGAEPALAAPAASSPVQLHYLLGIPVDFICSA